MKIKKTRLVSSKPRQLSQKVFVEYISRGMKDAWSNIFLMTGRLDSEVKPEYITTAAICFSLAKDTGFMSGGLGLSVKAEHAVDKLCRAAALSVGKNKVNIRLLELRWGRVDISLSQEVNGFCVPCAIIENKSYVRLKIYYDNRVDLYGSDWDKVGEDIKRNVDILRSEIGDVVSNTASTFYVSNNWVVLREESSFFLEKLKGTVEAYLDRDFGKDISEFYVNVSVFEIESKIYESREEAEKVSDIDGCPEYISSGHWFLAGVIIAISKTKDTVEVIKGNKGQPFI